MAEEQKIPSATGLRWSQEEARKAIGAGESFRWAQALVLDCGGDDDQWMAMLRRGTDKGARVGALVVANGAVAYSELIGAPQGMMGGPKRGQPRLTIVARPSDIAGLDFRPWVDSRFAPYSDVTIHTTSGKSRRFGLDWSGNADALVCALRELSGTHRWNGGPAL